MVLYDNNDLFPQYNRKNISSYKNDGMYEEKNCLVSWNKREIKWNT